MTNEEFELVCSEYVGEFCVDKFGYRVFHHANTLTAYVMDEEGADFGKHKPVSKKVNCVIEFDGKFLSAYEETYEILGGVGTPCADEDELRKILERFRFEPRGDYQMRLF